jgi:excisionase family DNA binding protein
MKQNQILSKLEEIQNQFSTNQPQILSLAEACKYLELSKSTIYKLTHTNKIPFYKPNGKKIYFLKSDLNNWLIRNRNRSESEIEVQAISKTLN